MGKKLLFVVSLIVWVACQPHEKESPDTHFSKLSFEESGIGFSNDIVENDTLNYFTFPYLYMGGGVAIGDINNDGLSDIFFTGNMVENKLYLNQDGMGFQDISVSAGVEGDNRWYTGATMADVNHDGWLDIYVCVSGKYAATVNQLYINNHDNTFTESAALYGIDDPSPSIQATFFDYDEDGYLDLYVANYPLIQVSQGNLYYKALMDKNEWQDSGHLYKNQGNGKFTDVTEEAGVKNFGLSLGIVAADFNEDGWQDLYVSNDFNVPDYFYVNNKDGTFSEKIKEATNHTSMFGMGADAADFNNDGLVDIVQVDMTPEDYKRAKTNMASMSPASFYQAVDMGMHYQYMQNTLQLNNGTLENGSPIFSDIARIAGLATTDWSWGALFADLDNDGWKDVLVTNGMKRDVNDNDANQRLDSGSFFGDNLNLNISLLPSQPIDNYVFRNNGGSPGQDFTFTNVTQQWGLSYEGFSNGIAYGDLDNDGDLDVVINDLGNPASIFENKAKNTHHYIRFQLKGPEMNPFGLGSRIVVRGDGKKQLQELTLSRGFQSSVEPIVHFGLGNMALLEEVKVIWPDGKQQILKNVEADQLLTLNYQDAGEMKEASHKKGARFRDITATAGIDFLHQEDEYDDFVLEPLLPHKNSRHGPGLAIGDINNDGLEDFFVGNAAGFAGAMYVQTNAGSFEEINGPWKADEEQEDTGAMFFDADNDEDLDLYVVSGGNDPYKRDAYYLDRLYINTPEGFVKNGTALPATVSISGKTVVFGDYDKDGDPDLFLGGRIVPGKYPFPAQSYILRNEGGKDQALRFSDVTSEVAPELKKAGLVTSALWDDFDKDEDLDLIIAGEWMSIRVFENERGKFEEVGNALGIENTEGWWYSLQAGDLDNDGDIDYVAGNLGLNYKYKASADAPFEVFANDFDENKQMDIVLSVTKHHTRLPLRGRECSSQQVPAIAKRFETYNAFASATLSDIYGRNMLESSLHYQAKTFAHYWIENKNGKAFEMHPLPNRAQFSSVNDVEIIDYDGDDYPDLLMAGNLYNAEVETPRNDASVGVVLKGNANGIFESIPPDESGLLVRGEVKVIRSIQLINGRQGYLIIINNDRLKLLELNNEPILYQNGLKMEGHESSRIFLTKDVKQFTID